MYDLKLEHIDNINPYEELIKLFLSPSEYRIYRDEHCEVPENTEIFTYRGAKDEVKRQLYNALSAHTDRKPKWGILTGIRPVKLAGELCRRLGSQQKAADILKKQYLVNEEKVNLLLDLYHYQREQLGTPAPDSAGIYIGIPFCPTRCLYCSFTSNQATEEEMDQYLTALFQEIRFAGKRMQETGMSAESIYIGGGTPTTLDTCRLERLLSCIEQSFDLSTVKEFTIEAGRPDTITLEKLNLFKKRGVGRISINPQSMQEKTLELIGRSHTVQQTRDAFDAAARAGIDVVNADLIAGLPQEKEEDFQKSLKEVLKLKPKNITLHTLAVKRSSRLKEMDEGFHYREPQKTENMLQGAKKLLTEKGYRPYYLYRQKHTAGNTENIGYCREDALSVYNVRIMEEEQTILALGAGGITKVYYPEENRLERIPNVSNYQIYIERIEEMLERKEQNLFRR